MSKDRDGVVTSVKVNAGLVAAVKQRVTRPGAGIKTIKGYIEEQIIKGLRSKR